MKNNRLFKILLGGLITSFLLVLCFTFTLTFADEVNEEESAVQTAIEWVRTWSVDDLKGWIIGAFSFLGVNATVLFGLAITLVRTKVREHKQSEFYKELIAKLDAEHQEKVEKMMQEFIDKLDGVQASVNETIESLDEKKKEEAKTSIEVLKKNLDEIKVEVEK